MGQYYLIINLSEKVFIKPNGIKMTEHCFLNNTTMESISALLTNEWKGRKFIWSGDYSDDEREDKKWLTDKQIELMDDYQVETYGKHSSITPYTLCKAKDLRYPDILSEVMFEQYFPSETCFNYIGKYLINYDKKEYVSFCDLREDNIGFVVHPLAILCDISNGRGAGDFYSDRFEADEIIGSWAGNSVGIESRKPNGFVRLDASFFVD